MVPFLFCINFEDSVFRESLELSYYLDPESVLLMLCDASLSSSSFLLTLFLFLRFCLIS